MKNKRKKGRKARTVKPLSVIETSAELFNLLFAAFKVQTVEIHRNDRGIQRRAQLF